MTISASSKDSDGRQLQSAIAALQIRVNAAAGKSQAPALNAQLDQFQRELVAHFLDVGRLNAANILSTMT